MFNITYVYWENSSSGLRSSGCDRIDDCETKCFRVPPLEGVMLEKSLFHLRLEVSTTFSLWFFPILGLPQDTDGENGKMGKTIKKVERSVNNYHVQAHFENKSKTNLLGCLGDGCVRTRLPPWHEPAHPENVSTPPGKCSTPKIFQITAM